MCTCSICFDSFTKSLRKRTDCSYCNVPVCRPCLQTFLLTDTTIEPVCPSCRAGWNREFLNDHLTATFRNGPFKRFRENILMEREKARFPETQEQAAAYKSALVVVKPAEAKIEKLKTSIKTLPSRQMLKEADELYDTCRMKTGLAFQTFDATPEGKRLNNARKIICEEYCEALKVLDDEIKAIRKQTAADKKIVNYFGQVPEDRRYVRRVRAADPGAAEPVEEPPKEPTYTHKCPTTDCEGFLNNKWTCSLCSANVCKTCHEIKSKGHTCNPDVVESVKAIKKEAKPCPKCTALISKIDGCDQMWCTQCQTAFSWRTGNIETRVIHNPHYFQWMRQNGVAPPPMGIPPVAAGACGYHDITQRLTNATNLENGEFPAALELLQFLQLFGHLGYTTMDKCRRILRENMDQEWRRQLRVRRMAQDLSEHEWKTILQRKEKESHKEQARLQILEMYTTAGMDILRQITAPDANVQDIRKQMGVLYDFTKKAADKFSAIYNCAPLAINIGNIDA